jgi:hypothetical protein
MTRVTSKLKKKAEEEEEEEENLCIIQILEQ